MIQREVHLEAVHALLTLEEQGAGVVDEHFQASVPFPELLRESADLAQGRQVRQHAFDRGVAGLDSDLLDDGLGLCGIPAHQDNRRPSASQLPGGDLTDAGGGSRYEAGLATQGALHRGLLASGPLLLSLARASFFSLPPCGGGLGWGVKHSQTLPPTPTLPHKGGGSKSRG